MSQDDEETAIQYTKSGGAYVRCGATRKKMDPGFYDVVDIGRGNFGLKPKVPVNDELIDLPGTVADDIFLDIGKFMVTGPEYQKYSLTHKRGYLFYGPPGSGKTSLGQMLAKRFIEQQGGIVMFCGGVSEFYNGVAIMRDVEPGRPSMYLIEEADTIVNNTHCLSILDGELSIQGAVFVAMTNYKDALPPRISNRPGRFDRVTYVGSPPRVVQVEYLRRVEARVGARPDAPEKIVDALDGLPMSMAHLREAFIAHVLMDVPLTDVRARFEIMAGLRDEGGNMLSNLKMKADLIGVEDPDDDAEPDYDREERLREAKNWSPGDETY